MKYFKTHQFIIDPTYDTRRWHTICANQEEAAEQTAQHLKMLRRMGSGSRPSSKGSAASASSRPSSGEREEVSKAEVGFVDDGEVTKQGDDGMESKDVEGIEEAKGNEGGFGVTDITAPIQSEIGGENSDGAVVKVTAWDDGREDDEVRQLFVSRSVLALY